MKLFDDVVKREWTLKLSISTNDAIPTRQHGTGWCNLIRQYFIFPPSSTLDQRKPTLIQRLVSAGFVDVEICILFINIHVAHIMGGSHKLRDSHVFQCTYLLMYESAILLNCVGDWYVWTRVLTSFRSREPYNIR